jgi:hypothetical protein
MKRLISVICFVALIAILPGCKKQGNAANNTSLVGTWELRQAQWGMQPNKSFTTGNGNLLVFTDSLYAIYKNGSRIKSGHYSITEDGTVEAEVGLVIPKGQFTNRIVYDNDFTSHKTFFEMSNNQLTILSGYFPLDGGSHEVYERISTAANISLVP